MAKLVARLTALIVVALVAGQVAAAPPALLRLESRPDVSRNQLIDEGLSLVAELGGCYLVLDDPAVVAQLALRHGLAVTVLDERVDGSRYAVVYPRSGARDEQLTACGQPIWREGSWVLMKGESFEAEGCIGSPNWFVRELTLNPLKRQRMAPGGPEAITPLPMVQDMVDELSDADVVGDWTDLVNVASTRYSTSTGCTTAANHVKSIFEGLGLTTTLQYHTGGHAPNVIGTLTGVTTPGNVYIVIGHLDDMPSSGSAPGADDNASGSAMVVTLAKAMACYEFASTVKFIIVTGEEFGLYGSEYYAAWADSTNENILGVLNGDMIAWEGVAPEALDILYNSASLSLGTTFVDAAAAYSTGCAINACSCPELTASDHASFWDHGFPALCGITDHEGLCYSDPTCDPSSGGYPYYHTSNDTIAHCGTSPFPFFVGAVKAYLATAGHLAVPVAPVVQAPTGLTAGGCGDYCISLSWSSATPGATFEVYRAVGGCSGQFEMLGTTATTTYTDTPVSGQVLYGYQVRAKDASGACISPPSACDEATATGSCTEPPAFAGLATVTNEQTATCTLSLGWTGGTSYCGGALAYNVYRSTTPGFVPGAGNRIADGLTGTTYTDSTGLVSGTTYYYVVRAVDSVNAVEDSNLVEKSAAPTGPGGGTQVLLSDSFEVAADWPINWTVTTGPGPHTCGPWARANTSSQRPSGGSGYYALTDSDACGYGSTTSTDLTSKALDASDPNLSSLTLDYDIYYNHYDGDDASVQVYNGSAWVTVWTDPNSDVNTHHTWNVTDYANANFKVRFRYQNAAYDYWFAVDDVVVTAVVDNPCTTGPASGADLAVTKTDGATQEVPGTPVTYTITVSNNGPEPANGATVSDPFPAAVSGVTWTCSASGGATCTASGAGNIADTVNLPSGGSVVYIASGTISASATGSLANTATVTPPTGTTDPVPGNNSATDTDTLTPQADLAVTKTDGMTQVVPGTGVSYTIVVSSSGPSTANGTTVTDTFPAGFGSVSWICNASGGATCTASGAGNIADTVNLPVGGSVTYTATGTVSAGATGSLTNTATATAAAGVTDPVSGNNSATDTDTLTPQSDLAITKSDGVTEVVPGGGVTYTIAVSASGPSAAPGTTVTDTFPAALQGVTWTCSASGGASCTASGAGNIADTVSLPSGGSLTYTAMATVSVGASGSLSNTATVTAAAGVTDPVSGNNSATDTDSISSLPQADLAIAKTDHHCSWLAGDSAVFTVTVSNLGPAGVTGATVSDVMPAGLTGVSWTCSGSGGATCTASGSGSIADSANLPVGGVATYTVTGTVAGAGWLLNVATVTAPATATDPVAANNQAWDLDALETPVFCDDLETGGTTAWSSTTP